MKKIKKTMKEPQNILTIFVVLFVVFFLWYRSYKNSSPSANDAVVGIMNTSDDFVQKAQNEKDPLKIAIITQAKMMNSALLSGDYQTFVGYTYPDVFTIVGGRDRMIDVMKKTMTSTSSRILSIDIGDPSDIISINSQLQAVVPVRVTVMQLSDKTQTPVSSSLIAISDNVGKSWTFVDASNKSISSLRRSLPNLSTKLVIPSIFNHHALSQ